MLADKKAVITGATQGFGLGVAKTFLAHGAEVLICSRKACDVEHALETLGRERVHAMAADISNENDVKALARMAQSLWGRVDTLVCNAAVHGPKGPIEEVDWQQWSAAISINLLGTVLCCREFIPLLRQSRRGAIILLSGGGATKPMPFISAYAASKAAVVRFGETLAEELRGAKIDVNAVAPGAMNTRLLDDILEAGPDKVGKAYFEAAAKQKAHGGTPIELGAELCAYLASDASAGITGKLISAVWDPWKDLDAHREDLSGSDIYTLRRIVPQDRGKTWG